MHNAGNNVTGRVLNAGSPAFQRLVEALSGRADALAEAEMGAPLDPRLADSLVDVMAGEEQLGLDTLALNVLDYRVRPTGEEHATITDLAGRGDLGVRVTYGLNELVIPDDASECSWELNDGGDGAEAGR